MFTSGAGCWEGVGRTQEPFAVRLSGVGDWLLGSPTANTEGEKGAGSIPDIGGHSWQSQESDMLGH